MSIRLFKDGKPCPTCGCTVYTDGQFVWCTAVNVTACKYGFDMPVTVEHHQETTMQTSLDKVCKDLELGESKFATMQEIITAMEYARLFLVMPIVMDPAVIAEFDALLKKIRDQEHGS